MPTIVSRNSFISVGGVDLSDHATNIILTRLQEIKDATCMSTGGNRFFRSGFQRVIVDATFLNDHASGSVEATLRPLVMASSSGAQTVIVQALSPGPTNPTSLSNVKWMFTGVIDGDLKVLDERVGEVPEIAVKIVPFDSASLVAQTTSS